MNDKQKEIIIEEIKNGNNKYVVMFENEPEVGDKFSIGKVTFTATERKAKITVL